MRFFLWFISFCLMILSCGIQPQPTQTETSNAIFTHLPDSLYPEDNKPTPERIELGRLLFHDKRLSKDGTVSCSSCHKQEFAFADTNAVSPGVNGRLGFRNAPTLGNVIFQDRLFMEGGLPSLEVQVLSPIKDTSEMAHNVNELCKNLAEDPVYDSLAHITYARDFDPYVLTRSISAFERTFITNNSKYDKELEEPGLHYSELENKGKELFFSEKTQCSACHNGPNFTNGEFHNIGLYEIYEDKGRYRLTLEPSDRGKFKVPSLRNIALTAPYMHDGSIQNLEEVVMHFNEGGASHATKSEFVKPLNLDSIEIVAIIAFLNSLTDYEFIENKEYSAF